MTSGACCSVDGAAVVGRSLGTSISISIGDSHPEKSESSDIVEVDDVNDSLDEPYDALEPVEPFDDRLEKVSTPHGD